MTRRITTTEAPWVRRTLIAIALAFVLLFLVLPLAAVFTEALRKGLGTYLAALEEPDAWSAIRLTLLTAAIVVVILAAAVARRIFACVRNSCRALTTSSNKSGEFHRRDRTVSLRFD